MPGNTRAIILHELSNPWTVTTNSIWTHPLEAQTLRARSIAVSSAIMGVLKVAPSAPTIKIVLKLVMIMKFRPKEEVLELQEASVQIEIREALRVSLGHSLQVLLENLIRSLHCDQALFTVVLTFTGRFQKIKSHRCFQINQATVAIKALFKDLASGGRDLSTNQAPKLR